LKSDSIEDFPEDLRNRLLHAILAHHGALERGSPVVPKTLEAVALRHADWLDGSVRGFIDAVEGELVSEDGGTGYTGMFRTQLYRGSVEPPEDEDEIPFQGFPDHPFPNNRCYHPFEVPLR
jgi:3'-5' exoribonuclease